jgi:hypothetical protein
LNSQATQFAVHPSAVAAVHPAANDNKLKSPYYHMSEQIKEIKRVYAGLETLYHTYFPKSDPSLIDDLLRRLQKKPDMPPIYMVEVFTKPGVDPEAAKKYIFEKTGMVPAIYENGTLFVANHKLTLEILKEISESDDVLEVAGEYTGNVTSRGSSHVHSDHCPLRNLDYAY